MATISHILCLSIPLLASITYAHDSTTVIWTSDSSYIRNGIEYVDPSKCYRQKMYQDEMYEYDHVKESYIKSHFIPPWQIRWFGFPSVMWWYYHGPWLTDNSSTIDNSTDVYWTSDTTYIRNGIEYYSIERCWQIRLYRDTTNEYHNIQDANRYNRNSKWFGYPTYLYWYYHSPDVAYTPTRGKELTIVRKSDTTYVKDGVEYWDTESNYLRKLDALYPALDRDKYFYWYDRLLRYDSNPKNPISNGRFFKYGRFMTNEGTRMLV